MKTSKFKKSISVLFVAAMTGVVLFSVGSAAGVEAPSHTPAENAGVSPTFSGLTVTGNAKFDGDYITLGNSDTEVMVPGEFTFSGAWSKLSNLNEISDSDAIWLKVPGVVMQLLSNDRVIIGSKLQIDGDTLIGNPAKTKNLNVSGDVTVSGDATFNGDIISNNGLKIDGQALVLDDTDTSYLKDNGTTVTLTTGEGSDLELKSGYAKMSLLNNGKIELGGTELDFNGAMKASRFGHYAQYNSAAYQLAADTSKQISKACPSGYQVVSCGAKALSSTSLTSWTSYLRLTGVWADFGSNTCWAQGRNVSTSNKWFVVYALCNNPDL